MAESPVFIQLHRKNTSAYKNIFLLKNNSPEMAESPVFIQLHRKNTSAYKNIFLLKNNSPERAEAPEGRKNTARVQAV